MSYKLIKGEFYVVHYSPDGDSIKFKANNPRLWGKLTTEHRKVFQPSVAQFKKRPVRGNRALYLKFERR